MVWTKDDFPSAFKNLKEEVRLKAIDIGNAMIADGYKEGRAIPIAISQAKEWAEDAGKKDKEELKEKDITKHKKESDGARLQDRDVEVKYRKEEKQWEVRSKGAKQADSLYDRKKEAEERAREITKHRDGKVISYKKDKS